MNRGCNYELREKFFPLEEIISNSNSISSYHEISISCKFNNSICFVLQKKKKEKGKGKVSHEIEFGTWKLTIWKFDSRWYRSFSSPSRSGSFTARPVTGIRALYIFLLSACTFSFIIHGKLAMNHLLRRSAQVQIYRCLFVRSVGRCCVSHALLIVTREITRVGFDSSFQPLSRGRGNVSG